MKLVVVAVMLIIFSSILALQTIMHEQQAEANGEAHAHFTPSAKTSSGIIIHPCDPGSGGGGEGVINK